MGGPRYEVHGTYSDAALSRFFVCCRKCALLYDVHYIELYKPIFYVIQWAAGFDIGGKKIVS